MRHWFANKKYTKNSRRSGEATEYLVFAANKLDEITRDLSARIHIADLEVKGNSGIPKTDIDADSDGTELNARSA